MAGNKQVNSDLEILGKAIVSTVPNNTGTVVTYNADSKEISQRTNAEIIADLGLITATNIAGNYVNKSGDTMTGQLNINTGTNNPYNFNGTYNKLKASAGYTDIESYHATRIVINSTANSSYGYFSVSRGASNIDGGTPTELFRVADVTGNISALGSGTFSGGAITIGGTYGITISADTPIQFITHGLQAQQILTGGILASNSFNDVQYIPTNGIYSLGSIRTSGDLTTRTFWTGNDTLGTFIEGYYPEGIRIQHQNGTGGVNSLHIKDVLKFNNNIVWHAGNDGSGSGLDADLLDGKHGSEYASASSLGNYLPLIGGSMTGPIDLNRHSGSNTGLIWYSAAYPTWRTYMSPPGVGQGPAGITVPSGELVTVDAIRSVIQNEGNFGWTWESGSVNGTTPTVVAEIRADGAARFAGKVKTNQLTYTRAINIPSGTNLDTITDAGFYDGDTLVNAPSIGWFHISVQRYSNNDLWVLQTATSFGSGNTPNVTYTRTNVGGTWTLWKTLANEESVNNLYDKAVKNYFEFSYDLSSYIPTGNARANIAFTPYNYQQLIAVSGATNHHPDMYTGMMIAGNDSINVENYGIYVDFAGQLFAGAGFYGSLNWKKVWTEGNFNPTTKSDVGHYHDYLLSQHYLGTDAHNIYEEDKFKFATRVHSDSANMFPSNVNGNAIISIGKHPGGYGQLLGFSSEGEVYSKNIYAGEYTPNWRQFAFRDWVTGQGYLTSAALTDYVHLLNDQNVGGVKRLTGAYTDWLLNNDDNNARGFTQSMPSSFLIGTLNDKDFALYRNAQQKLIITDTYSQFNNPVIVPPATLDGHALNFGQANAKYIKLNSALGINNGSGTGAVDLLTNTYWFDYNWANTNKMGSVINFSGFTDRYSTEIFASYNTYYAAIRTRNGDANAWNEPMVLWHDKNFNPINYYTKNESLNLFVGLTGVQTIYNTKTFDESPVIPPGTLAGHAVNLEQLNSKTPDLSKKRNYFLRTHDYAPSIQRIYLPSNTISDVIIRVNSGYSNAFAIGMIEMQLVYGSNNGPAWGAFHKFTHVFGEVKNSFYVEPALHHDALKDRNYINVHKYAPATNPYLIDVEINSLSPLNDDSVFFEEDTTTPVINAINTTDYVDLLNTKSDVGHDHDSEYLKLTGGTITGELTVEQQLYANKSIVSVNTTGSYWRVSDGTNNLFIIGTKNVIDGGSINDVGYFAYNGIHKFFQRVKIPAAIEIDDAVNLEQLNTKSDIGHGHTKAEVGLGNVDNTADAIKNVAYAVNSTRLYASSAGHKYGEANPYFASLNYNALVQRWRFEMSPATPANISVNHSDISDIATNLKSVGINLTQLNSFDLEPGMYRIEGVDIGHGGSLYNHIIQTGKYSGGGHLAQIAIPFEGNNSMFLRVANYTTWGSWERIAKNSDITAAINSLNLGGTYAPLSHGHAISDITGLQNALDGKVDDSQVLTNVPVGAIFTDTIYNEGNGLELNGTTFSIKQDVLADIASGKEAHNWGNHAAVGYLTGFTEADPTVPAWVKSITQGNIAEWQGKVNRHGDTMTGGLNINPGTTQATHEFKTDGAVGRNDIYLRSDSANVQQRISVEDSGLYTFALGPTSGGGVSMSNGAGFDFLQIPAWNSQLRVGFYATQMPGYMSAISGSGFFGGDVYSVGYSRSDNGFIHQGYYDPNAVLTSDGGVAYTEIDIINDGGELRINPYEHRANNGAFIGSAHKHKLVYVISEGQPADLYELERGQRLVIFNHSDSDTVDVILNGVQSGKLDPLTKISLYIDDNTKAVFYDQTQMFLDSF